MNKTELERIICENMKTIFGFSLTRLANVKEAEELTSDILFALLRSAERLREEQRFYGYMWKIAENTYMDYLRRKKGRLSRTEEIDENQPDDAESVEEAVIRREELHLLRRELSLLSGQYRQATVLYYMENMSCPDIADTLNISTEMVKYYLFRARHIIREGIQMERLLGEKSYHPGYFEIDFWGNKAGDDGEYRAFRERKIKGNILLAAYYTPVTAQEISVELGVALPYLEDELELLLKRRYLICRGGKYLTNIPIFTPDCTEAIMSKLQESSLQTAEHFMDTTDPFGKTYAGRFENENLLRWQKLLLCVHFALLDTEHAHAGQYGELPADGPYSLVNGGGGRGVIWGRSSDLSVQNKQGIQGIYNGCPSQDGRGSVIAVNFSQVLQAQCFSTNLADPVVRTAAGDYKQLPSEWQEKLSSTGYVRDGQAAFPVYTEAEYNQLRNALPDGIRLVKALIESTGRIAAQITADLAPAHIRSSAEYTGALVYRFQTVEMLTDILCSRGWLKSVCGGAKPAMCVILT